MKGEHRMGGILNRNSPTTILEGSIPVSVCCLIRSFKLETEVIIPFSSSPEVSSKEVTVEEKRRKRRGWRKDIIRTTIPALSESFQAAKPSDPTLHNSQEADDLLSNQLGIAIPMFRVTGCTGAFGRMNLVCLRVGLEANI